MPSGTFTVPGSAASVTVLGSFGSTYQVASITPSWVTTYGVSAKTATSFLVTFGTPAPAAGGTIDWEVVATAAAASATGALLAGDIINAVRDLIPDPVYDAGGNPLPDADGGLLRASTLYRWLNVGSRRLAQACGAIVEDWIALAQVAFQPWYALPVAWQTVTVGKSSQWPIDTVTLVEADVIWPSTSLAVAQSLWGYFRKRSDHLEFGLWPVPSVSDPATTLAVAIGASGADPIQLASTAGFLSFGYVQIENEIIQYQRLSTSPVGIQTITRGVSATSAVAHAQGVAVQHLALWVKGTRMPAALTGSTSLIELPIDMAGHLLETYLLSYCRRSENEHGEARALMTEFLNACRELRGDPTRKENMGQIPAYGEPKVGALGWGGRVIVPALLAVLLP